MEELFNLEEFLAHFGNQARADIAEEAAQAHAMAGGHAGIQEPPPVHAGGGPAPRRVVRPHPPRGPYAARNPEIGGEQARFPPNRNDDPQRLRHLPPTVEDRDNRSYAAQFARDNHYGMSVWQQTPTHDRVIAVPMVPMMRNNRLLEDSYTYRDARFRSALNNDQQRNNIRWDRWNLLRAEPDGTRWRRPVVGARISEQYVDPRREGDHYIMYLGRRVE